MGIRFDPTVAAAIAIAVSTEDRGSQESPLIRAMTAPIAE
jgi:hypothetical protein